MSTSKKASPRFESFPPEIRNMIYENLLSAELRKELKLRQFVPHWDPQHQYTYTFHTANTAILRTSRNINQEASAVLYRDILLVSIEWNTNHRPNLTYVKMPQNVAFNYARPGAPLPPCVVRVQHQYHDENSSPATTSTIVAVTDFPSICRLLLKANLIPPDLKCEARTSYSVLSLPKIGYSVDRLRELIWFPLRALREGRSTDTGERTHRNLRPIDCTGIFEETAAMLDWDPESDHGDKTDQEGDDSDNDGHGSDRDTSGEEDSDEEGSKEDSESDESSNEDNESDEGESNDDEVEEDGIEGIGRASSCSDEIDSGEDNGDEHSKAEDRSNEAANKENCSNDPVEKTSHDSASKSGHGEAANAAVVVEDDNVAGICSDDGLGHEMRGDNESNGCIDGRMDKRDAEEH